MDSIVPVHVMIGQKEHAVDVRCVEQYKHLGTSMSLYVSLYTKSRYASMYIFTKALFDGATWPTLTGGEHNILHNLYSLMAPANLLRLLRLSFFLRCVQRVHPVSYTHLRAHETLSDL
eukprot:4304718-Karenia_brevis.AAC.1